MYVTHVRDMYKSLKGMYVCVHVCGWHDYEHLKSVDSNGWRGEKLVCNATGIFRGTRSSMQFLDP